MAIILLVRHGSTYLNEEKNTLRGWNDVPLSDLGNEQAKEAAEELSEFISKPKKIYCGDLTRTKETAHQLMLATKVKPIEVRALRPWNPGALAGRQIPNIGDELRYYASNLDEAPEDGESMRTFIHRLLTFMSQVLEEAEVGLTPIVCVTSIRPIEVIMGWIEAGMKGDRISIDRLAAKEDSVRPGGFLQLNYTKKAGWEFEFIDGDEGEEEKEEVDRLPNERPIAQHFGVYPSKRY